MPHLRYRISFGKDGPLRYCSHLDLMRVWERVLRRAGIPLVYSQGFNPRPKIQIAAGLPLGYISTCEILDIWMENDPLEPGSMLSALRLAAPQGLTINTIHLVALSEPALQSLTASACYQVTAKNSAIEPGMLEKRVRELLSQEHVWRERRGKRYDLRSLIRQVEIMPGTPLMLQMTLELSPQRGTGRPDEVLDALEIDALSAVVTRTTITFEASPDS
ncbi:MAG: DUF2344 domain-containing protein [Anaerolineae bacterium]|nr:DUF2344 domain-containing protein [Anaerolineae bacterium]